MIINQFLIDAMPENMAEVARKANSGHSQCVPTDYGFTTNPHRFNLWDRVNGLSWDCEYFYDTKVLEFILTFDSKP